MTKSERAKVNDIQDRLTRMEIKVLGRPQVPTPNGKLIRLSQEGRTNFPELIGERLYLIRWSPRRREMIDVQKYGRTTVESYHYKFFIIS